MKHEDPYYFDLQIAARFQGRSLSVQHFSALFCGTEIWRAAVEDRLSHYAPPLPEAQIAVLFGFAADFMRLVSNVTGDGDGDPAWLDIYQRVVEAGEPIWSRHPSERRAPPTWRPNVSE